jgi:hypothetical protein
VQNQRHGLIKNKAGLGRRQLSTMLAGELWSAF